jgi:methyltransferase (TIGR00027 family)
MLSEAAAEPDRTAVRVALWRALHVLIDPPPHVLEDTVGLQLAAPPEGWQQRPDMDPAGTRGYRASIVARSRLVEDLVLQQAGAGVSQYVILGAGLDSFAQRQAQVAASMRVYEVDRPGPQAWKRRRLQECGFGVPDWLRLVPVDFEAGQSWWDELLNAGFERERPAVVASTGVSMYLSREANLATLRQIAALAPGSTLAMSFLLPLELLDAAERPQHEAVYARARAAGTPFQSFFSPAQMVALAREAGFREASHVSTAELTERYLAVRGDGLRAATGESVLVART